MPGPDIPSPDGLPLSDQWQRLVSTWVSRHDLPFEADAGSVTVGFDHPEARRKITLAFTTTRNQLLLVLVTDDRYLAEDQLALAAAAANAWNVERLAPMLAVCGLGGARPAYLSGIRTLPLACGLSRSAFHAMADQWLDEARELFTWCHREFRL
ncbi:hypothetical protein [Streptomyces sp. ISL-100]|uniref:hypothetical protein n=1 Tax=Streptomyces sp. ISL-100 TaxID=2819173 RepID=UPI001BEA8715|nr:hypothetical protein [Streptomyces sp. ISL-100]MBT2398188.1 hypothetical protein [Streptomyces sp. ISL-100]